MDPNSSVTVGQVVSVLRDLGFLIGIPYLGWKARALFEPVRDFFIRANDFMDSTDHKLNLLLTNHLPHLQAELERISKHKSSYVEAVAEHATEKENPLEL